MTRTDAARLALTALREGRDDDARRLATVALAPDAEDRRYRAPVLSFLLDFCAYRGASPRTWE
jgi:hypothetical protein